MTRRGRRAGFSLIEALVVLAIGGMALAVIFTIGVRAGDTGFSLGRRAMSAADVDLAVGDLRAVIRSIALQPALTFRPDLDQPFGEAARLEADVVMERATQCAPQGWAGRMILTVEATDDGGAVLICQAGERRTPLIVSARGEAAFSYSADGGTWSPQHDSTPPDTASQEDLRSAILFVRYTAPPSTDVVERAYSGRPDMWLRPDDGY